MGSPWLPVLAPLGLVLAWLAWRAWRGTWPPRPVLNALFSLLLLLYLLVTAGLGLFWVAQQHLPVFDWHYLFGYALLVLVAVHLAFNLRQLGHHLSRWRTAAPAAGGRRPALRHLGRGAGLAALAGLAFWFGLRQGRTVLQPDHGAGPRPGRDAGPLPGGAADALELVERFHAHSAHSRSALLQRAASTDWGPAPPPFKPQPAAVQSLPLPRAAAPDATFGLPQLGTLLWHVAGVSLRRGGIAFRTAPSSGALFASEFYVATRDRPGLPAGLWHHDAASDRLVRLQAGEPAAVLLPAGADLAIWATAVFRRSGHKYGDRTYRYVLADLGHALENLRQAAAVLGRHARLLPAFDDEAVARALGVDGVEEGVLAGVLADNWRVAGTPPALPGPRPPVWRPAPPLAGSAALGVTAALHRAGALQGLPAAPVPAAAARPAERAAVPRLPLPPAAPATSDDTLARIAARRSLRRYRGDAVTLPQLASILGAMVATRPLLSEGLHIHLVSHRVQGLARAAWAYDAEGHALQAGARHDEALLERRSRAAALDQQVIGDAAVVFVLVLDRAVLAAAAEGPARAYRHAFIEAGLMGERLYLQAQAIGLGVCAVGAFYDDETAALVGVDPARHWPLHVAALGVPA